MFSRFSFLGYRFLGYRSLLQEVLVSPFISVSVSFLSILLNSDPLDGVILPILQEICFCYLLP